MAVSASGAFLDIIRYVRSDIGDDDSSSFSFTDLQLTTLIAKSAIRLNTLLGNPTGSGDIVVFEQNINASGDFTASGTFTTPSGDLPDHLVNLVTLQVECIIAQRRFFDAVNKGIRVQDGDTSIDTSVAFRGFDGLVSRAGGPCQELVKAIDDYNSQFDSTESTEGAIIWKGNVRKIQLHEHPDGVGNDRYEVWPDVDDWFGGSTHQNADNYF